MVTNKLVQSCRFLCEGYWVCSVTTRGGEGTPALGTDLLSNPSHIPEMAAVILFQDIKCLSYRTKTIMLIHLSITPLSISLML